MLVVFKCKASGQIMMFGDVAKQMLKIMGKCDQIPGALEKDEIDAALENLQAETVAMKKIEQEADNTDLRDDEDEPYSEPVVSLHTRALPLIDMLKAAKAAETYVMWEEAK
ncbi:hypothetical protein ABT56_19760 [Photobacterium aquae]|uniref:DUF1840 domain-containing protein n=1 Tax=Photobacterium aquae TaxID=1195763 RepID=A0A0J1JMK8_9GAMM|nr:DUF1840 domain-containing protein [Photobacterium aquae]KLV03362.1 hypothetical protein ABT56_19760 [Photobacterium aquae]